MAAQHDSVDDTAGRAAEPVRIDNDPLTLGLADCSTWRSMPAFFEFRSAQSNKIPLARWGPIAREFHGYITHVHNS